MKGIVGDQMLRIALTKVQQQVGRIDGLLYHTDVFSLDRFQHYAKNRPFSCRQKPTLVLLDSSPL